MESKITKSWGNIEAPKNVITSNSSTMLDVGNLNSYGDCCLPLHNVSRVNKNKIVGETILNYQIKNNSYLYGTPGKSTVTIGGAVASDTHGKDNVWGGSFYKNVKKIYLSIYGDLIETSKNKEPDLFKATIGGYGLTGSINDIELYESNISISKTYQTFMETGFGIDNLLDSFDINDKEFWVGWINLLDKKFPWVTKKSVPTSNNITNATQKRDAEINISFPFLGENSFKTLNLINKIYFNLNKFSKIKEIDFYNTFFPISFFTDTRNISKNRKIVQVQFSIPYSKSHILESLLSQVICRQVPLLCSIKKLSKQENLNNLSFYQDGWSVAVDFSYHQFNKIEIKKFYELLASHGGKIYLAKDFTLDEKNFKLMYPEFFEWEKIVKSLDPKNLYQSNLSKRLGLKKW